MSETLFSTHDGKELVVSAVCDGGAKHQTSILEKRVEESSMR